MLTLKQLRDAGQLVIRRLLQGEGMLFNLLRTCTLPTQCPLSSAHAQREAIQMAWKLLTEVYGLDPERLYVSYFQGDEKQGLAPDLEAKQIWIDTGVPESRIVPGNAKDNFWGKSPASSGVWYILTHPLCFARM
jgi:hypothetical protein